MDGLGVAAGRGERLQKRDLRLGGDELLLLEEKGMAFRSACSKKGDGGVGG